MAAKLIALSEGPDLPIDRPVLLVGRHAECDLQLNSGKISRRHCVIATANNRLIIRDLGSTNGVHVNGVRYDESELHDGDELTIGNFRYQVRMGDTPTARTPRPTDDAALEAADQPVPLNDARASQVLMARKPPSS